MSYLVLARKWRPQCFADIVGQRHVVLTLTNAIRSERLSHAYLFAGPRGIGKTSVARILAKALNCEKDAALEPCNRCDACRAITEGRCLDVLEIDGASNRGIDDVRQLRESVKYAPSSVRAKVYIIDEVHMLTTDAFNALLKTLEEPPAHVHFVLATTEPLKVPPTILSRCQRFDFSRLTVAELVGNLARIAEAEKLAIPEEALALLARQADGSVRDSLTLLDQIAAAGGGPLDAAQVRDLLGLSGSGLHQEISAAVVAGDGKRALLTLQRAHQEGRNLQELADGLVTHFRNLLLLAMDEELAGLVETTAEEREQLQRQATAVRPADALRWVRLLLDLVGRMRSSAHGRVHLEVALAEMAALPRAVDLAALLARLPSPAAPARPVPAPPAGARAPAARAPRAERRPPPGPSAAGAPAPAPSGSAAATHPPGDSMAAWQQVVDRVRSEKAFLGSCLHESRLAEVAGGRLRVQLVDANGFTREQIERPGNRRFILRTIEEVFGEPLGLELHGAAATADAPPPAEPSAAPPAGKPGPPAAGTDRVREIADLMDGDIIGPSQ